MSYYVTSTSTNSNSSLGGSSSTLYPRTPSSQSHPVTASQVADTPRVPHHDTNTQFSHPQVEQVMYQLQLIARYHTVSHLLLSLFLLGVGVALFMAVWFSPLLERVYILGLPFSRSLVTSVGLLLSILFFLAGVNALNQYRTKLPHDLVASLSDKQRKLLGLKASDIVHPTTSTTSSTSLPDQGVVSHESKKHQTPNTLRGRNAAASFLGAEITPSNKASDFFSTLATSGARAMAFATRGQPGLTPQSAQKSPPPIARASLHELGMASPAKGFGSPMGMQLSSPLRNRDFEATNIESEYALNSYIENIESTNTPNNDFSGHRGSMSPYNRFPLSGGIANHTPSSSYYASFDSTPRYAVSPRSASFSSTLLASPSRVRLEDSRSDTECGDAADKLLHSLNLNGRIDACIRKLKAWLSVTILTPILKEFQNNAQSFEAVALWALQTQVMALTEDEKNLLRNFKARKEEAIAYLMNKYTTRPEVAIRLQLQRFLQVGEMFRSSTSSFSYATSSSASSSSSFDAAGVRSYVLHRLTEMTSDVYMNAFQSSASRERSIAMCNFSSSALSTLPSDPEIIIHCLSLFIDDYVQGFSNKYIKDWADWRKASQLPTTSTTSTSIPSSSSTLSSISSLTPSSSVSSASGLSNTSQNAPFPRPCIVQARPPPAIPYYFVAHSVSTGKPNPAFAMREWLAEPGRSNLFQAIILWVLYIETYQEGRIGHIRLADPVLNNLTSVLYP